MTKRRCLVTLALSLVIALAAAFAVEGVANRRLLRLSGDARADIPLALSDAVVAGGEAEEEGEGDEEWYEEEFEDFDAFEEYLEEEYEEEFGEEEAEGSGSSGGADEAITLDSPEASVSFAYSGYIHDLTLKGSASNLRYRVTCTLPDGSEKTFRSIFAECLGEDSIHIGCEVEGFTIAPEAAGSLSITGVTVANSLLLNRTRMLFTALMAAALCLLIGFRRELGKRPACAFLIVALAAGLFLSLALPINTGFSYDDQIHAQTVIELSYGGTTDAGGVIDFADSNWKLKENDAYIEMQDTLRDGYAMERMIASLPKGGSVTPQPFHWEYSYTGYLPAVAGMSTARLLGLGLAGQVRMARLFNMLTFVLLTFAALCVLKRFRLILAAVALTPGALFLACNFSYDPFGTGCCFLGIALFMSALMDRDSLLTQGRAALMLLCFLVGSMTKIVYIPLILLVLILPRSKFPSRAAQLIFKLGAVAVFAGLLLSQVLMTTADMTIIQDGRSEADSAAQLAWILAHPLQYFGIFCSQFFGKFQLYMLDQYRVDLCYLPAVSGLPAVLSLGVVFFAVFTDNPAELPETRFDWKQRLYVFLLSGVVIGMVFTAMYIAFTPTGAARIDGAQPRYLLPVIPLCYMLLNPDKVRSSIPEEHRTLLFSLLNLLILAWFYGASVLPRFWC